MVRQLVDKSPVGGYMVLHHSISDDFTHYVDGDDWTLTAASTGTAAVGDAVGGVITSTTAATDNDDNYIVSTNETFKIVSGKPIQFDCRFKLTEANTDDANIMVGLMNAVAADSLQDNGGGPRADFSGAVFYKVDGGSNWNVMYSDGTTQTSAELDASNRYTNDEAIGFEDGKWHRCVIDINPKTSTYCDVAWWIDTDDTDDIELKNVYKMTDVTYASATEMQIVFGVKAGGANAEALLVDWASVDQRR